MTKQQFCNLLDVYAEALMYHRGNNNKIARARNAVIDAAFPVEPSLKYAAPSGGLVIVTAEQAAQPLAFRHWTKDEMVPYDGCHCATCLPVKSTAKVVPSICGKPMPDGKGAGQCINVPGHEGDCDDMPF